jgi:hypothetical protein
MADPEASKLATCAHLRLEAWGEPSFPTPSTYVCASCGAFFLADIQQGEKTATGQHPQPIGVGMPQWLALNEFGAWVHMAYGTRPFLVGSALKRRDPRDIDVRLILTTEDFQRYLGNPGMINQPHTPWAILTHLWAGLLTRTIGARGDFQIVTEEHARPYSAYPRIELGGQPGYPVPNAHEIIARGGNPWT